MNLKVTGIIIKESDLNESDKSIGILTAEQGIVYVIAKKSKLLKNRLGAMLQLFSYGEFMVFHSRNAYLLNSCKIKEFFLPLRNNLEILSLAQYFCQLCISLKPESYVSEEFLRVFLNCIFFLINNKIDIKMIKSIYELRSCSLCGYMPELTSCSKCGIYKDENMKFSIESGRLFCEKCSKEGELISNSLLLALRHIIYSPVDKLFSFSLSENILDKLSFITEKYVSYHVSGDYKSLEFYKKLISYKDQFQSI